MIRVLLIDDSPLVLHILQRMLSRFPEIQVVGTAANGREALDLLPALNPDVICVDLHMPVMNGLEFTREAMANYPRPILVVSVSVEPGSPNIFRVLEAGAVDILPKPRDILGANLDKLANELASKIRILSGVRVFRRHNGAAARPVTSPSAMPHPQTALRMVVIGASTGGPQALREILGSLPAKFPLPVVCVQHIGSSFLSEMVMWLAEICPLPVRKAVHGEAPQAGIIYFAPEDVHLELDNGGGRFALSLAAPIDGHRPSVTVTMRAAAHCFGAGAVGVLLTGMGRDGADGMADIAAAGGITIAQDEASSTVYGMPKQAVELGAVQHILPLEQIAPTLEALANNHGIVGGMAGK
ncbi:MAG TPA: chemotaxis-specific protein-glutamate methyltransferase CheB [Gallionella sp.]|nr:chemotaxis-specific protein-glutamate methyltransferase CheB [Gallionella sp.]